MRKVLLVDSTIAYWKTFGLWPRIMPVLLGLFLVVGAELLLRVSDFGSQYDFVIKNSPMGKEDKYSLNSQLYCLALF